MKYIQKKHVKNSSNAKEAQTIYHLCVSYRLARASLRYVSIRRRLRSSPTFTFCSACFRHSKSHHWSSLSLLRGAIIIVNILIVIFIGIPKRWHPCSSGMTFRTMKLVAHCTVPTSRASRVAAHDVLIARCERINHARDAMTQLSAS